MRNFVIILCLMSFFSAHAETVREKVATDPRFILCCVIFGITQNEDASVKEVRIANVLDATSESRESLKIKLPQEYLANASRAIYSKPYPLQKKDGKITEFFVYYFYSPQFGNALIDDADADISNYEGK